MYKIKNWILNHKVAVGITLVLFTPLVTIVFGAIGLLFSTAFAVLGFIFGMLNAAGVVIVLLAGLGYAGKRVWENNNNNNNQMEEGI